MVADEPDEEGDDKSTIIVNGVMTVAREGDVINAASSS